MAKRVNTKFLIGLTVTLVVAGVAALGVRKFVARPNAQKHIDAAKQYLAQGNYEEAWVEYSLASQLDRTNKEVRIEQGNVANHRTEELGYSALKMARDCWQNALDIDPHYKPALD